jgi:hypothetical protein
VLLVAPDGPGLAEQGIELLESAGLEAKEARMGWSALGAYTIGALELAPDEVQFQYGLERLLDGLEAACAIETSAP